MAGMRDPLADDPPPSRFDPEELDIFAQIPDIARTPPSIQWETSVDGHLRSGTLHPQLLILALSRISTGLVHHLPGRQLLGTLLLSGNSSGKDSGAQKSERTANIYSCSACPSLIIVSVEYHVQEEGAYLWTKTLFQAIQPERVLILGLTPIYHFRGKLSSDEPSLYLLETDEQKRSAVSLSEGREADDCVPIASYYPSGSLVDGLAAALLTHCQLRGLRGRLLLTWPEEGSRMAQILAAKVTYLLREIQQGSDVQFLEAVKLLGNKPLSFNNLYI